MLVFCGVCWMWCIGDGGDGCVVWDVWCCVCVYDCCDDYCVGWYDECDFGVLVIVEFVFGG